MRRTTSQKHSRRIGFSRYASRLLLVGQPLLLIALCDYAARLYAATQAGEVGFYLRLGDAAEEIFAAAIILWGGALLLDYMEKREEQKK